MRRKILFLLVFSVVLFGFSTPLSVFAHSQLVDSSPKQGELLSEAPNEVQLHFSEQLQLDLVTISITDSNGQSIPITTKLSTTDPSRVIATLPVVGKGSYNVEWSVLSGDGHPVNGKYSFSYGQKITNTAGGTSTADPISAFMLVLLRFVNEGWLLLSAGFVWVSFFAARRKLPHANWFPTQRWKWLMAVAWIGIQFVIWFLYAAGLPENLSTKLLLQGQFALLTQIPFAIVLLSQVVLFFLLLIPNMVTGWYLFLWSLLTAAFAFHGHTWSSPSPILALTARILHLWSGALWLGGITYLLFVGIREQENRITILIRFRSFFSRMALLASSLLIISGLLLMTVQTDWSAIITFQTFWSRFLLIKIMLVIGMLLFAFLQNKNWQKTNLLERDSLRTEWIFGLIALLLGIWMSQIAYPI